MKRLLFLAAGLSVATSADAVLDEKTAQALMQKAGCVACHEVDRKLIGPAFVDVASRYRNDPGAPAMLRKKVKEGGIHVWGEAAMPPNVLASDADIRELVDWMLTLKK
jgi:cytochrome c